MNLQEKLLGTNDDQLEFYLKKYNVSRNLLEVSMEQIRNWYDAQPHLPKSALDDRILIRYLASCKYSVERSKEKIDCYFSSKSIFPEIFTNRDPCDPEMIESLKCCDYIFLPQLTSDVHRIMIMRYTEVDANLFNPLMGFKFIMMMSDVRTLYDTCDGDQYIWDLTNLKLTHVLKVTPSMIKKMLFIVQKCYASKIKGIHIINCPNYAQTSINLVKSVIKKKIADRIHFHKCIEDLHKYIDPKYLPKDYDGDLPPCKKIIDDFIKGMQSEEWKAWFLKSERDKSDESKRIVQSGDIVSDMIGISGSFRKLDID